jgi:hypothetical protein
MAKDFWTVMKKASNRIKLDNIPASFIGKSEHSAYQISTPDGYNLIITFYNQGDDFNIKICSFNHDINETDKEFAYLMLRGNNSQTCEEMLNDFLSSVDSNSDPLVKEMVTNFNLIVNAILYINTGQPDVRDQKGHKTKGISFEGKKQGQKIRKYKDISFHDSVLVGFNFKKEYYVNGYFRWQPYGPKNSLRRFQWIDGCAKNKKDK